MADRIEITPHIRVLDAGPGQWAVWDDYAEECPLYPTLAQAVFFARELAKEYAAEAPDPSLDNRRCGG
jgi:hypothetical protein